MNANKGADDGASWIRHRFNVRTIAESRCDVPILDTDLEVLEGDVVRTKTGRGYRVLEARQQAKGKHAGRYHLTCVVMSKRAADGALLSFVHTLAWYKR